MNKPKYKKASLPIFICLFITIPSLWLSIYYCPVQLSTIHFRSSNEGVRIPVTNRNGKSGYLNGNGKVAIPFIYKGHEAARPFDGGYAIVNNKHFINRAGKRVSDEYTFVRPFDKSGLACISKNGKEGFINRSLEVVIEPIWEIGRYNTFDTLDRKAELVRISGDHQSGYLSGMINRKGELIVPTIWNRIDPFNRNAARVLKNWKWGLIDRSGKVLLQPEYDSIDYTTDKYSFMNGVFTIKQNNQFAVVDDKGKLLIPFGKWKNIELFNSAGFATVENDQGKFGVINASGVTVISPIRDEISPGTIDRIGSIIGVRKDGKMGMINTDEEVVMQPEWDKIKFLRDGLAPALKNGKWGFLNANGEIAIPCQWDNARGFYEKAAIVKKGHYWGLINQKGNYLIEPKWDSIRCISWQYLGEPLYEVKSDQDVRVMNDKGQTILEPTRAWAEARHERWLSSIHC